MPVIISAKGKDFGSWRAAGEFAIACRQKLLEQTDRLLSVEAEELFIAADRELERRTELHQATLARLHDLTLLAGRAMSPAALAPVLKEFFGEAYGFFGQNRSATAFYALSGELLRTIVSMLIGYGKRELGLETANLPPLALIVLGSGGRREFSPFSRLPFLLVHESGGASDTIPLRLFGKLLHEAFEEIGLLPDDVVTPRNPAWNSDMDLWRHTLLQRAEQGTRRELIDLLRLTDLSIVYDEGPGTEFALYSRSLLKGSRQSLELMVRRILDLPRGVGIMGGLKYERRGPHQGFFDLFSHGLLPLSASTGALTVLRDVKETGTTERLRALLRNGALNVELAERLLESWHSFHELRLEREASLSPAWDHPNALFIDTEEWELDDLERFKTHIETVSTFQRQVAIAFETYEGLA